MEIHETNYTLYFMFFSSLQLYVVATKASSNYDKMHYSLKTKLLSSVLLSDQFSKPLASRIRIFRV